MHNKVVHTLARACLQCGLATLRFNFRGVGSSAGSFDAGRGETQDALAVVQWARTRWPALPLTLAGFSFGALVSLRAAALSRPARLICVAPAVAHVGAEPLPESPCPWLIVQGDADEIVDYREVQSFVERSRLRPQLALLPGAEHFFHRRLNDLDEVVVGFLRSH